MAGQQGELCFSLVLHSTSQWNCAEALLNAELCYLQDIIHHHFVIFKAPPTPIAHATRLKSLQISIRSVQSAAQPAPAPPAAVPPPAPAPHAGICSVHVSMYAQDSKIYSYILQSKKKLARRFLYPHVFEMRTAVRYSTQTNMHTQANCENANTRALEVEKEQRLHTTLI